MWKKIKYIAANDLIEWLDKRIKQKGITKEEKKAFCEVAGRIMVDMPRADVRPVEYGAWRSTLRGNIELFYCNKCRMLGNPTDKYCSNCGAYMDERKYS